MMRRRLNFQNRCKWFVGKLFEHKFNATQAAYETWNCTRKAAKRVGSRALKHPLVQAELKRRFEAMDSENFEGKAGEKWLIDGMISETDEKKVSRAADRIRAREILMKSKGMLRDKVEQTNVVKYDDSTRDLTKEFQEFLEYEEERKKCEEERKQRECSVDPLSN